jgi:hypothetical protein
MHYLMDQRAAARRDIHDESFVSGGIYSILTVEHLAGRYCPGSDRATRYSLYYFLCKAARQPKIHEVGLRNHQRNPLSSSAVDRENR